MRNDKEVAIAATTQTWRALVRTNLANVDNDVRDAAKAKWPDGKDDDRLVCSFLRLTGEVVEDADA